MVQLNYLMQGELEGRRLILDEIIKPQERIEVGLSLEKKVLRIKETIIGFDYKSFLLSYKTL